jgi:hypothetical protein
MSITPSSTETDVLAYLQSKCGSMVARLGVAAFTSVDGEVFLGITPATIDMILPGLETRERGLLLARIETMTRGVGEPKKSATPTGATPRLSLPPAMVSSPSNASVRDVTPPPGMAASVSPSHRSSTPTVIDAKKNTIIPQPLLPLSNRFPRLLVELWHEREFVGESWLPEISEFVFAPQTYRLGLRRGVRRRGTDEIFASRKWFGALAITCRFHTIESRLDLYVIEVKDVARTDMEGEYFMNLYSLDTGSSSGRDRLNLVYSSQKRRLGGESNTSVQFDEMIRLTFQEEGEGGDGSNQVVVVHERTSRGVFPDIPSDNAPGRAEPLVDRARAPSVPPVSIDASVDRLRRLMFGEAADDCVSLPAILTFAQSDQLFNLDPRYNRFESYLLPTHEVSAMFGSEYTIRSITQLELLRVDPDYMRSHSQVVELLLGSWGASGDFSGVWNGHSWLLRHVLLSCVLLHNRDWAKRVSRFAKELGTARQVDLVESGYGEILFTLMGDKSGADKFWNSEPNVALLKNPELPKQRTSLGKLMGIVDRL